RVIIERDEPERPERGERTDPGIEVLRATAGVEDELDAPLFDLSNLGADVRSAGGVHDMRRAELFRELQPLDIHVDGDDGSSIRDSGGHDRSKADRADAENGDGSADRN